MLTATQWELQRAGGTWSTLFNRTAWVNSSDVIAVLVWYLFFSAIGVAFFPLTRLVFAGLRDKGFGISRLFGLLVIGVVVWLSVSLGVPYTHQTILIVLAAAAFFNLILFVKNKNDILKQLHDDWKLFLQAEALFLGLFLFFLLIRLGNPDLWHPSKGGEKPMDFSYFNAILKSTSFPPYDPWFAGGKLNYYYYGAYLAGLGVKMLGIIPSVAYNLILPLWYAFLGSAFYAAITSLSLRLRGTSNQDSSVKSKRVGIIGIFGVLIAQFFGNLGIPAMVAKELVELGGVSAPETATFLELAGAFFVGIARMLQGTPFQMYRGDWYWVPSRAIPGEPITEFPYFTFLYGDPHAHLYALPITVLVLCWLSSLVILTQNKRKWTFTGLLPVFWGGVVLLGSLIPTNTWDFPTYLLLTIALFFMIGLFLSTNVGLPSSFASTRALISGMSGAVLAGVIGLLSVVVFLPYLLNNTQQNGIQIWNGARTPVWSYLMHWGLFLLCIVNWLMAETTAWMAETPLTSARSMLRKHKNQLIAMIVLIAAYLIFFAFKSVWIGWIALPMMLWVFLLMLRRENSLVKNVLFFMAGTTFFITLFVEFFCLKADLGRMNMVFKLYMQAWILFVLPAAVGTGTVFREDSKLEFALPAWRLSIFYLLVIAAASYPILASIDKIKDRMSMAAPHTLDGMAYMESSQYFQDGFTMDLAEDFAAIKWMQDHVQGSPVIIEGNATEYKWGNRYTIYTGLPGVIGWNYHQRQQRPGLSDQVWQRIEDVSTFYNDASPDVALALLQKYAIRYIVVGQMEHGMYDTQGIAKFAQLDGFFWDEVFRVGNTAIYQVNSEAVEDFLN